MPSEKLRAGVVIVVRHPDADLVMAFERMDVAGAWQLPQGGIDIDEEPLAAAWRELGEETGLSAADVEYVTCSDAWFGYRYPNNVKKNGNHIGQCQQWFFFVARTPDVAPTPDNTEFGAWRWIAPAELAEMVVEFRRPSYRLAFGLT